MTGFHASLMAEDGLVAERRDSRDDIASSMDTSFAICHATFLKVISRIDDSLPGRCFITLWVISDYARHRLVSAPPVAPARTLPRRRAYGHSMPPPSARPAFAAPVTILEGYGFVGLYSSRRRHACPRYTA